jgi:GTP diphosphokinase / guanosine-3',5'-bis(diphosphate) 3'-diphosphatase
MTKTNGRRAGLGLVIRAAYFAAWKHRDQRRKDSAASPYINHPIALAKILSTEGGVVDAKVLAAALLHDTVEDTETTPEELRGSLVIRLRRWWRRSPMLSS